MGIFTLHYSSATVGLNTEGFLYRARGTDLTKSIAGQVNSSEPIVLTDDLSHQRSRGLRQLVAG